MQVHGILMVSAFGVIIPLGVFTSRYGKAWKHWFNTHRAAQVRGWWNRPSSTHQAACAADARHWLRDQSSGSY